MKGFLSFFGITLIAAAFGLILVSFYGNPLEELKIQERQQAYQEMRANHSANAYNTAAIPYSFRHLDNKRSPNENEQSCKRLSFEHNEKR